MQIHTDKTIFNGIWSIHYLITLKKTTKFASAALLSAYHRGKLTHIIINYSVVHEFHATVIRVQSIVGRKFKVYSEQIFCNYYGILIALRFMLNILKEPDNCTSSLVSIRYPNLNTLITRWNNSWKRFTFWNILTVLNYDVFILNNFTLNT
jgi:ribosomal protein S26